MYMIVTNLLEKFQESVIWPFSALNDLIRGFVFDSYRSGLSFVTFDLLLTESCPSMNCENRFSRLFFSAFDKNIELKFDIQLCLFNLAPSYMICHWSTKSMILDKKRANKSIFMSYCVYFQDRMGI
jgi:hypothetical protein